jgi:predicted secreted protein
MAIKNASDLLVYKKSPADQAQIIKFDFEGQDIVIVDGIQGGYVFVNNLYSAAGVKAAPLRVFIGTNFRDGNDVGTVLRLAIDAYSDSDETALVSNVDAGTYSSTLTITNDYAGDVDPVTITPDDDTEVDYTKIDVTVTQDGETNNSYQPIGYSTSATLTTSNELRDITNKDSLGLAEYAPGLKTFEITTDALQDFTQDEDFKRQLDDLNTGDSVFVRFSERLTGGNDVAYAGYVKVTSLSMDAGVEENATFSVTLQGTGDLTPQTV